MKSLRNDPVKSRRLCAVYPNRLFCILVSSNAIFKSRLPEQLIFFYILKKSAHSFPNVMKRNIDQNEYVDYHCIALHGLHGDESRRRE